jgi:hypothetical protein
LYNLALIRQSSNVKKEKKTLNLYQIFQLKSQRQNLLINSFIWFASGFCFYGLILNLEHVGTNIFIDSIITFIGEAVSELLTGYLCDVFGRLVILKGCGFLGGFSFIFYEILIEGPIKSVLIFTTSFGFSGVFNVIYIYTPEAFPTSIRSTVMSFVFFISRIGALLVPSVSAAVEKNAFVFGALSIFSSYLAFRLPETLGQPLEDDVPESKKQMTFLSSSRNLLSKDAPSYKLMVDDSYFNTSFKNLK